MFSAEIRINGNLIGQIYGHNLTEQVKGKDSYAWEYYRPVTGLVKGIVLHRRDEGIEKLLTLILKAVADENKRSK
jgi:hypothetical protein